MPNTGDQFSDSTSNYPLLDPTLRTAMAQAFVDQFRRYDDPGSQEYAREDPHYVSAAELAQMQEYAADVHPEIITDLAQNPQFSAALASSGAPLTELPEDSGDEAR